MQAKIIPILNLPRNINSLYSYLIEPAKEANFQIGQIVAIPFAGRIVKGVIFKLAKTTTKQPLKTITPPEKSLILPKNYLKVVLEFAAAYAISPSFALKLFVPSFVIKDKLTSNHWPAEVQAVSGHQPKQELYWLGHQEKINKIAALIKKSTPTEKILIIEPQISQAKSLCASLREQTGEKIALYHSELKPAEGKQIWLEVLAGKHKILVSSKIGLFLPFANLSIMVIDHEESLYYKNDLKKPYDDAKKIAKILARRHGASLLYFSAAPSVETYSNTPPLKVSELPLPGGNRQSGSEIIKILVNLEPERAGN